MENRNSFLAVDAADLENFEDVIRQAGYSLSDFQLEEEACERPQAGPAPGESRVTVRRKSTGASRCYRASIMPDTWVYEFGRDLRSGVFGARAPRP